LASEITLGKLITFGNYLGNWYGQEKGAGFGEGGKSGTCTCGVPRVGYMAFKWTVLPLRKFGGVFFTRRVA